MFKSYYWKEGRPYGRDKGDRYQIVTDPYHKRYSIEEYLEGKFSHIIYDSNLFDFRELKDPRHAAWLREERETESILRNPDDRVVLIEKYLHDQGRCKECRYFIPQGIQVGRHLLYYTDFGDPFDGVILYDMNNIPIMRKKYKAVDGVFCELLEEVWDFSKYEV